MERRSRDYSLANIIIMNAVTGMTAVFDRRTAETAIVLGAGTVVDVLHDHLVALAAALSGEIIYLDAPLVDYVQHGRNTIGASDRKAHGIKLAPFMRPRRYVRRCTEQFLRRAHLCAAIAQQAGIVDGASATRLLPDAESLFGRGAELGNLLGAGVRRLANGELRTGRLALRCLLGKAALLVEAARCGELGRFEEYLTEKIALLLKERQSGRA
jgi:hypothetical protein